MTIDSIERRPEHVDDEKSAGACHSDEDSQA
jgi:hypothetical protein